MTSRYSVLIACLISAFIQIISASDLARGFNERINWVNLEDGLKLAKEQEKPIMMLIHKSWCGACKALKPKFAENKEIEELSHNFVMVNILDDEEPHEQKYSPDGGYIPRILILNSDGDVQTEHYNKEGSKEYKYYYPAPEQIAGTMKSVLEVGKKTVVSDEL